MNTKSRSSRKKPPYLAFGQRLQGLRSAHNFTVEQFADECRVPMTTAREWLNGKVLPRGEALLRIGARFARSIDWLLSGEGPEMPGATRPKAHLEGELAAAIVGELNAKYPPLVPGAADEYMWVVAGSSAFRAAVDAAVIAAKQELAMRLEIQRYDSEVRAILAVVKTTLTLAEGTPGLEVPPLVESIDRLLKIANNAHTRMHESLLSDERNYVLLVSRDIALRHLS